MILFVFCIGAVMDLVVVSGVGRYEALLPNDLSKGTSGLVTDDGTDVEARMEC